MSLSKYGRKAIEDGSRVRRNALAPYADGSSTVETEPYDDRYRAELEAIDKSYGTQQSLADSQHRVALRQQAQKRSDSKRESYIAHERLQKYLPQARAVSGIEGMGMTETAKIQGLNAYLGERSAADAVYQAGVSQLEGAKQIADTERETAKQQAKQSALSAYLDRKESAAEQESAAVGSILDSQASKYFGNDGKISEKGYQALEAYVNANRDKMTETDRRLVELTLEGYRNQIRSEKEQEAYSSNEFTDKGATFGGITKFENNKNLVIKTEDGNEYRVQLNAPDNSSVIDAEVLDAAQNTKTGEVFGFRKKLYLNHHGDIYAIEARDNSYKEDYDTLYKLFFEGGDGKKTESEDKVQTLSSYSRAKNQTAKTGSPGGQGKYRGRN
ncbi:MAG: hypothetical protein E7645_00930 [Ruminococcaceae bacterium]|nr:hypothetical protein [Oscillospiraceae bacterium]